MISHDYQPSEPLKEYIKEYRLRHFICRPDDNLSFKPFPPRPEQSLVFYPRGMETTENTYSGLKVQRPKVVVSGQFTQRINRYLSFPEFMMLEVDLQPGALHRLTGIPSKEIANTDIDAETVFPAEIRRVSERLTSTDSYPAMIAMVDAFFLHLVQKQKRMFLAIDEVLTRIPHQNKSYSVDAVAKHAYLSPRQLERKFDERVGISPKTFLRICRFNQSYWMRLKQPGLDWLSIALECGYNDYQHLVKDYKEFADTTPTNFFREEVKAPGRVLGLTK